MRIKSACTHVINIRSFELSELVKSATVFFSVELYVEGFTGIIAFIWEYCVAVLTDNRFVL